MYFSYFSKQPRAVTGACFLTTVALTSSIQALGQQSSDHGVKTVLLVHGAWANGSSWSKVIPLLAAISGDCRVMQASTSSQDIGLDP